MAALPSLAGLSLNVQPTQDFCKLNAAQVAELNAGGGIEPLTMEKYMENQDIDSDNPTFCIKWRNGLGYHYYYGRALWHHVLARQSERLPVTDPRDPGLVIEQFDIDRLRDRFEESRDVLAVADGLMVVYVFFEGRGPLKRKVRTENFTGSSYFSGSQGKERLVRGKVDDEIWYYEGCKDEV